MTLDLNWTIKTATHNRVLVATIFLPKPCPLKIVGKIFVFLAVRAVLSHFSDQPGIVSRSQNTKHLGALVSLALGVWPDQNLPRSRQTHLTRPCLLLALARAFAQIVKSAYQLRHVCPSISPQLSARLPLAEYSWNLILGTFTKMCRKIPDFVKIGQQYRALCMKTEIQLYCWQQ